MKLSSCPYLKTILFLIFVLILLLHNSFVSSVFVLSLNYCVCCLVFERCFW